MARPADRARSVKAAIQRWWADRTLRMSAAIAAHALTTPSAPPSSAAERAVCICSWLSASEQSLSASLGVIAFVDTVRTLRTTCDGTLDPPRDHGELDHPTAR
jgi:hypothetical protein